jgi:hypothetical protein
MRTPSEIIGAKIDIVDYLADHHIARQYAYLSVAEKLARAIADKAFVEPTIIRAGWRESQDRFLQFRTIQCRINIMSFKDWAIEHLRAGNAEFGSILEIPLTDERMMVERDLGIFYTK